MASYVVYGEKPWLRLRVVVFLRLYLEYRQSIDQTFDLPKHSLLMWFFIDPSLKMQSLSILGISGISSLSFWPRLVDPLVEMLLDRYTA